MALCVKFLGVQRWLLRYGVNAYFFVGYRLEIESFEYLLPEYGESATRSPEFNPACFPPAAGIYSDISL